MKTGVLTLPLHTNYGGILQAYALQTVLRRMGHEAVLIEREQDENIFSAYRLAYLVRSAKTRRFVNRHIRICKVKQLAELTGMDALVVGSDQVWRPRIFSEATYPFLDFARHWKIRRVAYAASFGVEKWCYTAQETGLCADLLSLFDAVSVREESAGALCSEHLRTETVLVLDPTMLLSREDYSLLITNETVSIKAGSLCTYILDGNADKMALISEVAKSDGMTSVVELGAGSCVRGLSALKPVPSVEHWILGFQQAALVVTDSFHACVFSILFHKPFIVYGNPKRGMARFHSLLKLFGLEDRLVTSAAECAQKRFQPIDWEGVDARVKMMRELSESFLMNALK